MIAARPAVNSNAAAAVEQTNAGNGAGVAVIR
jgi:hypothetical protein